MGDFFLKVGQILSVLGCAGSVIGTLLGILQVVNKGEFGLALLILLGGVVSFCFEAAMYVVFTEVLRLRADARRVLFQRAVSRVSRELGLEEDDE